MKPTTPNMLEEALRYAKLGWYVLPLHAPQFDESGLCVGCSCEAWKRTNNGRQFECGSAGKHPRFSNWEAKATRDLEKIKRWWTKWPDANVGIAAGKSGLVCIDADTYKEAAGELPFVETDTTTSMTGGGGEHFIYQHPDGDAPLGNGRGRLPDWLDVRGHGGQFVAPPSVHSSGRRYVWKPEYAPWEKAPARLPIRLRNLLAGTFNPANTTDVKFSEIKSGRAPDFEAFKLSATTKKLIEQGHLPNSDRSQNDQSVITALVLADATDDEIKAIYDHFPIGVEGKYGEKGKYAEQYLFHSIKKAREYVKEKGASSHHKKVITADYWTVFNSLGYTFRMNDLDDRIEVNGKPINDSLVAKIDNEVRDQGLKSSQRIKNAYTHLASENRYHPIREHLEGLKWDGRDHLGTLVQFLGVSDKHLLYKGKQSAAYAFLKRWLIGAVAKVYKRTQNFCLVIDGPQGVGKSYFVRWLCPLPRYYSEAPYNPGSKDSRIEQRRTWIWELGELQAVTRKSDREALKHGISATKLTERMPYAKHPVSKPNLTSFIGTINESGGGFLNDPTGYRRFVIVHVKKIDWGYERALKVDDLWAQAIALYKSGESQHLTKEERKMQRTINDGYESVSVLAELFFKHFEIVPDASGDLDSDWMPAMDIIRTLETHGLRGKQQANLMELAELMKKLGAKKDRPRLMVEGKGGKTKRRLSAYLGVKKL